MCLFNYDKIAEDYSMLAALAIFIFWPLMGFLLGTAARFMGTENSKLNKKVENFLGKYLMPQ